MNKQVDVEGNRHNIGTRIINPRNYEGRLSTAIDNDREQTKMREVVER